MAIYKIKSFFIAHFPSSQFIFIHLLNFIWTSSPIISSQNCVKKFSCHVISYLIAIAHLSKFSFLIPILLWLRKNTSSCQLSTYSYQRETWSFSQFFWKKAILQKISLQYCLWFCGKTRFYNTCSAYISLMK